MMQWLRICLTGGWLLAAAGALASYHTFRIEQIYSNADGSVQFVVLRESQGVNGENLWSGQTLTSTHSGLTRVYEFPRDLPGGADNGYGYGMMASPTANRRVLIATQGFAALGLVAPDYVVPNGFLAIDGGTLNFAGVDVLTYAALPTDGVAALGRDGMPVQNLAVNFAGRSASIVAAPGPAAFAPVAGIWANADESGTGYALDFRHGVLVVAIYAYQAGGPAQWYLAAGPVTDNVFTATLDRYTSGQCISCAYTGRPTLAGNAGTITLKFTSSRSAVVNLPGGRVTTIEPFPF